ncbi:CDP-glucose 4,6-dehydratase [Magnetospirillum sp. UT-4]|uniref:CDP-glucose 4,6-dehydratase n=1 Tax=Magnetospirillum sp. UT-4 TaxID=2681467 RepID=UPI001C2D031B|nr:CDP-glucose 4,6-dehydratase [Magnetospirillum sp. UT-4]
MSAVDPGFWRGKSVFLTGHTGFKGAWLSLWLARLGASVHGYALEPPSTPNLFDLARIGQAVTDTRADLRDLDALLRAMDDARPDVVIHMAAQSLVRPGYEDPAGTFATNLMGTVHVLEAARRQPNLGVALMITTDKCYENREWVWAYREDEPMGGFDPYSASKGCAELAISAYRRSFFAAGGARIASARAGNVIGGGDWARDRLVPDIMVALAEGRRPFIRNPEAVRPWQHVLEPLSGYLVLCQKLWRDPSLAEGWNFGPADEDARPVRWIADRLCALWGEGAGWDTQPTRQPHEAHHLRLDCSKARARLGWRPRWDLGAALERIVAWYGSQAGGADARALTETQIAAYDSAQGGADGIGRQAVGGQQLVG